MCLRTKCKRLPKPKNENKGVSGEMFELSDEIIKKDYFE